MSWEERLFQRAWRRVRDLVLPARQSTAEQIGLAQLQARLLTLARALCAAPIEIAPAQAEGGFAGNVFYLPRVLGPGCTTEIIKEIYLFRVVYLSAQWYLNLNWPAPGDESERNRNGVAKSGSIFEREQSLAESRRRAIESAPQVLAYLKQNWPGLQSSCNELHVLVEALQSDPGRRRTWQKGSAIPLSNLLYGRWMHGLADHAEPEAATRQNGNQQSEPGEETETPAIETELQGTPAEELEILDVDQESINQYTLAHNFEKIETLAEFDGTWRELDGSDELEEHQEALQELNVSKLVRTDNPVHSIYGLDIFRESNAAEVARKHTKQYHVMYPEWDVARRCYRPDYVTLFPQAMDRQRTGFAQAVLKQNRSTYERILHSFSKVLNRPRWLYRQLHGSDPDTAALVARHADVRAGTTPSRHIYMQRLHRESDTAVLILLDLSLSADGYLENRRILDREVEAVVLLGEAMHKAGLSFQVDGFNSHTRNALYYKHFKLFGEDWERSRDRLGHASTGGYTRIGAALRHANFLLARNPARRRWLLLLSDARPNDFDRYEGRHGMADVRQAMREATQKGIGVFTLAMGSAAHTHLALMLGPGQYTLLRHPAELPDLMAGLVLKFRT